MLVNGSYACENDPTLNGILKGEFGFPGCMYIADYLSHLS